MNWFILLSFIIWIYLLTVFKRGNLKFWFFCVGSVGFFIYFMIWVQPFMVEPLSKVVISVAGIFGKLTGIFEPYIQYGVLFIQNKTEAISLYIDYECSGIIEISAYLALLWFYPLYQLYEKVLLSFIGIFSIIFFNVLRIIVICTIIHFGGNEIYYFAHTIFARVVFYVCSITLYFYVFTKAHIVRQKVGSFKYDNN